MLIIIFESIMEKISKYYNHISLIMCNQLNILKMQYINDICCLINLKLQI